MGPAGDFHGIIQLGAMAFRLDQTSFRPTLVRRRQLRSLALAVLPCRSAELATASDESRQTFAERFDGHWEGQAATFSAEGQPQPLPDYILPPSLKEWEIDVRDWQSRCQSSATWTSVQLKFLYLTPTVGCEADNVAQQTEWSHEVHSFRSDGSYVADLREIEHAPADAELSFAVSATTRLRILLQLDISGLAAGRGIRQAELHHERKYSENNINYLPLEADSTVPQFATRQRIDPAQLRGRWTIPDDYWVGASDSQAAEFSRCRTCLNQLWQCFISALLLQ